MRDGSEKTGERKFGTSPAVVIMEKKKRVDNLSYQQSSSRETG